MYDIIGDIHGYADALEALLRKLGYRHKAGAWRHPSRTAIFVGDLIDRGTQQVETIQLVRNMVEAGAGRIVMGNHEYNALLWATPDPDRPGEFLRRHTDKHRHQHRHFLEQVGEGSQLHAECLRFFQSFPLWLDLGGLRVVHACWHPSMQERLAPHLADGALPQEALPELAREGSATNDALEIILKGLEQPLPPSVSFLDKDGHERKHVRVRWWLGAGATFRDSALLDDDIRGILPTTPIPAEAVLGTSGTPLFFGHYWMKGQPVPMSPYAACVDWSIAAGGVLAAYRFDGEASLTPERFVTVR